ncbi:MAG: DMT family transporter, partial [Sphaerochaetaceae bacterium]|nr:DMT family transporter [Sphaerochaetaceae bacterium]
YSLVIEQATRTLSSFTILIYAGSIGLVLLFPFTFTEGGWSAVTSLPPVAVFNLLYLGIFAAGLSYIWYFEGIKILGSGTASAFLNLEPVAAILIGILFLSEALTAPLALGAALVIAGLFLTGKSG